MELIDGHCGKPSLLLPAHPKMVYDVITLKLPVGSSHDNIIDIVSADNTVRVAEKFITGPGGSIYDSKNISNYSYIASYVY